MTLAWGSRTIRTGGIVGEQGHIQRADQGEAFPTGPTYKMFNDIQKRFDTRPALNSRSDRNAFRNIYWGMIKKLC